MLGIFALGFRHGFDVDHVAAITDISGSQPWRWRAFLLCELYAVGHATMVISLGLGIAWSGIAVPDAGRLVGATLVALGSWVLWCVVSGRPVQSRASLIARGLRRLRHIVRPRQDIEHEHEHDHHGGHRHEHLHPRATPDARVLVAHRHRHVHRGVPTSFTSTGAVAIGMVHGAGAETPTQVLALASGTGSLAPFLAGLLLANTLAAVAAATVLTGARTRALNGVVALFSLAVGLPYLFGAEPPLW